MKRILIIDDDETFLRLTARHVRERFPNLQVQTCADPVQGLTAITPDLDFLLIDLEMPTLDGAKILDYARKQGLSKNRIIILSGRDADYLHQRFPNGSCLAVLNKHEARQKAVLEMVLASLQRKSCG